MPQLTLGADTGTPINQQQDPQQSNQSNDLMSAPTQMGQEQQASYDSWQRIKAGSTLDRIRQRMQRGEIKVAGLKGVGRMTQKQGLAPTPFRPNSLTSSSAQIKEALISTGGKQPIPAEAGQLSGSWLPTANFPHRVSGPKKFCSPLPLRGATADP